MTKTLLLLLTSSVIISSCSKHLEDRLIGEWRLDAAYKKDLFDRDYFLTGYEDGIFILYESGSAGYISSTDTLSGFWEADHYTRPHYNSSAGEYENRILKYLHIYLANFQRNKILNWEFDEFSFRNSRNCIRAVEYSFGRDRYYEFVKP